MPYLVNVHVERFYISGDFSLTFGDFNETVIVILSDLVA